MSRAQVYLKKTAPEYLDPNYVAESNENFELTAVLVIWGIVNIVASTSFLVISDMGDTLTNMVPFLNDQTHVSLILWGFAHIAVSGMRDLRGSRNIFIVFIIQKLMTIYYVTQFHLKYNIVALWESYASLGSSSIFKYMVPAYLSVAGIFDLVMILLLLIGYFQTRKEVVLAAPKGKKD